MLKFAFAHHPTCEPFRDHLYNIKGVWICKGCAITYPMVLLVFLFSIVIDISFSISFTIVIAGLLITMTLSINIFHKKFAFIKRIFFGLFTGSFIYFFFSHGDFIVLIFGLIILYIILLVFSVIRYFHMKNTCSSCVYLGDWNKCDGFIDMKRVLFKDTIWEVESNMSKHDIQNF